MNMARQTTTYASRALKLVLAQLAELGREERTARWIEQGDWPGRLARHESGGVFCEEVGSFEGQRRRRRRQQQQQLRGTETCRQAAGLAVRARKGVTAMMPHCHDIARTQAILLLYIPGNGIRVGRATPTRRLRAKSA